MQLTTALSDFVLAIVAFSSILRLHKASSNWHLHIAASTSSLEETPLCAMMGFFIIGLAAAFGVLRFGLSTPPHFILKGHSLISTLASRVGMSLLAAQFDFIYFHLLAGWAFLVNAIIVLGICQFVPPRQASSFEELLSAAPVISTIVTCIMHRNWMGLMGTKLVVMASVIGVQGSVMRMPAVDVFHYTLSCALYLVSRGLTEY